MAMVHDIQYFAKDSLCTAPIGKRHHFTFLRANKRSWKQFIQIWPSIINASFCWKQLRDFIHEQLYGTNSGYFNQAKPLISPLTKALDFKAFLGKADYLSAVAGAHEHLGVRVNLHAFYVISWQPYFINYYFLHSKGKEVFAFRFPKCLSTQSQSRPAKISMLFASHLYRFWQRSSSQIVSTGLLAYSKRDLHASLRTGCCCSYSARAQERQICWAANFWDWCWDWNIGPRCPWLLEDGMSINLRASTLPSDVMHPGNLIIDGTSAIQLSAAHIWQKCTHQESGMQKFCPSGNVLRHTATVSFSQLYIPWCRRTKRLTNPVCTPAVKSVQCWLISRDKESQRLGGIRTALLWRSGMLQRRVCGALQTLIPASFWVWRCWTTAHMTSRYCTHFWVHPLSNPIPNDYLWVSPDGTVRACQPAHCNDICSQCCLVSSKRIHISSWLSILTLDHAQRLCTRELGQYGRVLSEQAWSSGFLEEHQHRSNLLYIDFWPWQMQLTKSAEGKLIFSDDPGWKGHGHVSISRLTIRDAWLIQFAVMQNCEEQRQ